jgi:hypothetical protein
VWCPGPRALNFLSALHKINRVDTTSGSSLALSILVIVQLAMAPTTAIAAGARAAAASPVATSDKAAARSVGLGVPALPPLPGSGLALRGQARGTSFCK